MENLPLPEEVIIMTSNDKLVTLTNMRVKIRGTLSSIDVLLEEISLIKVYYHGDLYYLLAGIVGVFVVEQMILNVANPLIFIIIQMSSCLVVVLLWLIFHRAVISIILIKGNRINIAVNRKAINKISDFIQQLQSARKSRLEAIK